MNLAKIEAEHIYDITFDFKGMKKVIDKEFKRLSDIDEIADFICKLRARAWYWQEEDHPDLDCAKFYNKMWQYLLAKAGSKISKADYMDLYYAVDPNP